MAADQYAAPLPEEFLGMAATPAVGKVEHDYLHRIEARAAVRVTRQRMARLKEPRPQQYAAICASDSHSIRAQGQSPPPRPRLTAFLGHLRLRFPAVLAPGQ